ncbi:MAG: FkbM family methyltransferase [Desulfuromonadales bacterium]|nr:FkbM family methyltransferase [Desulfuromonadales bacterium]
MNTLTQQIVGRIAAAETKPDFLEALFRGHRQAALDGAPVVLFGAGGLGAELCATLRTHGVSPVCFCDNDDTRKGGEYCNIPVITYQELQDSHRSSLIIIASHKYLAPLTDQLLRSGFVSDRVLCQQSDPITPILFMYAMIGSQCLIAGYRIECGERTVLDTYREHEQAVLAAYKLLSDEHSQELYIAKLALMASNGNFELFQDFIRNFSQPVLQFGFGHYEGTPEDYFYFNNDVLTLSPDEVYIDVGAYDGDTVATFVEACSRARVEYRKIHAFEPDPHCYQALLKNTAGYQNVVCHPAGVWSHSQMLRFSTSDTGIHDQAGTIDHSGNIEIPVVSLDEALPGEKVTLIKMDPGGNVIPEAVRGAAGIIARDKPKLALGAYHSVTSMFEIPLLLHGICPAYKLYLRHNTYHLCDTDLYATL